MFLGVSLALSGAPPAKKSDGGPTLYDFNLPDINGAMMSFAQFKGKVLLIVNVASNSCFTPQYAQLEALYEKYKDAGLVVIGFPSNDFGAEEPENEAKIKTFAESTYHVTFPLFSKVAVRGDDTTPLFHYLTKEANKSLAGEPHWNFTKFLIDRKGAEVARVEPSVTPEDPNFLVTLEKALDGKLSSPSPQKSEPAADAGPRRDRSRD